ncbi:MAG: UbiA family prenyltransferase [Candidatus Dormibacter sp.]
MKPPASFWRFFDERDPRGGRVKAWLFLTHPGPSLLVTAVTVAAAGLLIRRMPSERTALGLVLVMLPSQLAIGTLNDWADAASDRVSKPFKPIARGLVRRRDAALLGVLLLAVSLSTAAWLGTDVLLVSLLGAAAGVSYDLALKRTPLAVVAWWAGFTTVPLLAMVITGRLRGGVEAVLLAGLLATALLVANGVVDIEGDRLAGEHTLPVVIGVRPSQRLISAAMLAACVGVLALMAPLGQGGLAFAAAALFGAGAGVGLLPARARALSFPVLAVCVAAATVSWLAALPVPAS